MTDYEKIKSNELKGAFSDFSFSKEAQKVIRSDYWKTKYGLWTLLSAACDEAAKKCYEHINSFADGLIDIDTCSIHALKSIAESVDLGFLCKGINESYPKEVLDLINLLSVPKDILMNSTRILSASSTDSLNGEIAIRVIPEFDGMTDFTRNTIFDIKNHINDIDYILNSNLIFTSSKIEELIGDKLFESIVTEVFNEVKDIKEVNDSNEVKEINDSESERKIEVVKNEVRDYLKSIKCYYVIVSIERISIDYLRFYENPKFLIEYNDAIEEKSLKDILEKILDKRLNWFLILTYVLKHNFYNEEYEFYLVPRYFNSETNTEVDLTPLFVSLLNPIMSDWKSYNEKFITFHFYNLIASKLRNEKIRRCFYYVDYVDDNGKSLTAVGTKELSSEYLFNEDEFLDRMHIFLNEEETERFLLQEYPTSMTGNEVGQIRIDEIRTQTMLDFIEYMKFISSFNVEGADKIEFDVLEPNFYDVWRVYYSRDSYGLFGRNGIVMKIAKELTDITLHIVDIRNQIKTSIQQYSIIGTKRIATDILADFFLKNYTKRDEWGYVSESKLIDEDGSLASVNGAFKSLSSLFNEDAPFSIDVIEYYDDTKYLNIESDMPDVVIGQTLKSMDEEVSWWIDSNSLLVSGFQKVPTYEDVYAPCSYFTTDYNEKFWTSKTFTIGEEESIDLSIKNDKYKKFYGQYFSELNDAKDYEIQSRYIENVLQPFFAKTWDLFALSAIEDYSNDGDELKEMFKHYSGAHGSPKKYENIENRTFPTIAPIVNIEHLLEADEIDKDILFVAKFYYSNIFSSLKTAIEKMLKMYDKDGIPDNGWMQQYISFHGYSTRYEYSENKDFPFNPSRKEIDSNDPYIYSSLQKYFYNKDEFLSSAFVLSGFKNKELSAKLSSYLTSNCIYDEIVDSSSSYFIDSIEYDDFKNVYALMKVEGEPIGQVIFRENFMTLGVPLSSAYYTLLVNEERSDSEILKEVLTLAGNCASFGVVGNLIWMFGKIPVKNCYKLVSFRFTFKDFRLVIDESTYKVYSYDTDTRSYASFE